MTSHELVQKQGDRGWTFIKTFNIKICYHSIIIFFTKCSRNRTIIYRTLKLPLPASSIRMVHRKHVSVSVTDTTTHMYLLFYKEAVQHMHSGNLQKLTLRNGLMKLVRHTIPPSANSLATSEIRRIFSSRSSWLKPRFLLRP